MIAVLLAAVLLGSSGQPILPNGTLTPGAVRTTDAHAVCTTRTSTVRNVPASEKKAVYEEYHLKDIPGKYEVDHLISLELGGSNDIKNLWPEVYDDPWGAHVKDKLENYLHKAVCSGDMTLQGAQREIQTNWIKAYKQYLKQQ